MNEAVKMTKNSDVEIKRPPEQLKNGIVRCAIVIPNFPMWDKLLNQSVLKPEQEN